MRLTQQAFNEHKAAVKLLLENGYAVGKLDEDGDLGLYAAEDGSYIDVGGFYVFKDTISAEEAADNIVRRINQDDDGVSDPL